MTGKGRASTLPLPGSFFLCCGADRGAGGPPISLPSSSSITDSEVIDYNKSCVAEVLVRLDPSEICRLAVLGRAFRGATAANHVWEVKLPDNYRRLLERVVLEDKVPMLLTVGKKEIYAQLCRPYPFDGGTKVPHSCLSPADLVV